jgi:hypothetical protein
VEILTVMANGATGLAAHAFDRSDLKVLELAPNIVCLNPSSDAAYMAAKSLYRDAERLLPALGPGRGARTPLIYLIMAVSARGASTATVGEVNVHWRSVAKWT